MSAQSYCINCGAVLPRESKFCVRCGSRVEGVVGDSAGNSAEEAAHSVEDFLSEEGIKQSVRAVGGKFREFTGTEKLEGFSIGALFSDVLKKHTVEEVESSFTVGTPNSIPDIKDVDVSWPRPWMFLRALTGSVVVYFLFVCALEWFENIYLIPGLIMTGAMAIPLSMLLFFFEMNARRNVSLYRVLRLVLLGGILSLIFSLILYSLPLQALGWMGASIAGLIEEPGKLIALLVLARSPKYRYKLNGLLFGACVGAGFEIFESMGYALNELLSDGGGIAAMNANILLRGLLAPCGSHIVWTAICGEAMWRVKGAAPFKLSMIKNGKFWHLAIVPVVLHMLWDSGIALPFFANYLVLGFVAWVVVLALIQEGLKEIRAEKSSATSLDIT